ncbi:hypothetical protein V1511DRAFT_497207 [Dipodascopsis uninucleata]
MTSPNRHLEDGELSPALRGQGSRSENMASYYSALGSAIVPVQVSSIRETYAPSARRNSTSDWQLQHMRSRDFEEPQSNRDEDAFEHEYESRAIGDDEESSSQLSPHQILERLRRILRHNSSLPPVFYRDFSPSDVMNGEDYDGNDIEDTQEQDDQEDQDEREEREEMQMMRRSLLRRTGTIRWRTNPFLDRSITGPASGASSIPHASMSKRRRKYDEDISATALSSATARPVPIPLELVYCDSRPRSEDLGPKNVLAPDWTVFCAISSSCSLVFRRVHGKPFSVSSISVKVPPRAFSSPAQTGEVYLAMSASELNLAGSRQSQAEPSYVTGGSENLCPTASLDSSSSITALSNTSEPVATFRLAKCKARRTINLPCAMSARYIHIKITSSDPNRPVDLQSVAVSGFLGPQCFPILELR